MDDVPLSDFPKVETAIEVAGAYKKFSSKGFTLSGLNMTVKQGTIYGLLGPSGCGKTTLLNCLTDRLKLDGGRISLKITKKSQIGYMPQDLALFQEFSIKEHLMFYGYIYSMRRKAIIEAAKRLVKLLELPDMNTIVSTMSGGQQRRVSLCIALLHNPDLLILDEPTVGIDVILSESIWDNLVAMSQNERKTIVITTHYIQEARRSNTIGLMRSGKILAEDDPTTLMRQHDSCSLEDVFLKLCRQELILNDYGDEDFPADSEVASSRRDYSLFETSAFEKNRVLAYSMKSFIWMRRNIALVLFTLLLPILQCTLISVTVGTDPEGLALGVVNDEVSENTGAINLANVDCKSNVRLSLEFQAILQAKGMRLVDYKDIQLARKAAKQNVVWGALYFNSDYSRYVHERLANLMNATNQAVNGSDILVWFDLSNQIIGQTLKDKVTEASLELFRNVVRRCNYSGTTPGSLAKETAVYGSTNLSFRQFMTPANAVLFAFYLPMMFTVGAMLMEKTSGLLERCLVAGLTLLEVAIGHIVLQTVILVAQIALMMIVLYCVFENPIDGKQIIWCVLYLLFVGTCGMFYGFFVAALCDSFTTASCLAVGTYFPLFMLSGAIWPVEGMYGPLKMISTFLPITSSVEGYRSISVRSWGIAYPPVYVSVISLTIWTTIFALLAVALIRARGTKT